jgi:D-lactate dehydrogenase (cytochrome)
LGDARLETGIEEYSADVCVPISRLGLADAIGETIADVAATGIPTPIVGHVGDGNFHCGLLVMMDYPDELERAGRFLDRLAKRAITMGGTCTGEHGVGQGKMKYLEGELGYGTVGMRRAVKAAIAPDNIMNPDKIIA